jgi:putative hydrolase of the HAD superfamily
MSEPASNEGRHKGAGTNDPIESVRPVRAVLFDAVGTLFRTRGTIGEIYSDVASRHGVLARPDELDRRFEALTGARGMPVEKAGWRRTVALVFENLGRFDDFDAFFEEVYALFRSGSRWRLFPEVPGVLEQLGARGVRMGVVTNFDDRIHQVLEDLGITRYFDAIQTAEGSGLQKPDPRFFTRAAATLQATAQDTIVVGDDVVQDLGGAQRAGMRGLLVDRRPGAPTGRWIIHDLEGLMFHL